MLQASEKQRELLRKYWWIFSPVWFVPEYPAIIAAMVSPGSGPKGTSEKKRRSRSIETGREDTTALAIPQTSPLDPQTPPLLTRGFPEAETPASEEESCSPASSKKRKKKERKEDASQSHEREAEAGGETHKEEKKDDGKMETIPKDPTETTVTGSEKRKKRAKPLLRNVKVPMYPYGRAVPGKSKGKGKKVKAGEIPVGSPQPAPGDPSGGTGAEGGHAVVVEDLDDLLDDLPLSARCPLPSRQTGHKRLKRKKAGKAGRAGKDKPGERLIRKPARLGGMYKHLLKKSSQGARPAEWSPEPPLPDSPNLAVKETEMALLDTLRGRAQLLDDLGSPLPVARLLGTLCSPSFEGAATTITLMVEKLTRGIMREGPVWGLPREAVYAVTRQQPRTLPPPSTGEGVASSGKPRKGNYWRRGGKKANSKDNPKGIGPEEKGSGKLVKARKPPVKPSATLKEDLGRRGPDPPGSGRKGKKHASSLQSKTAGGK